MRLSAEVAVLGRDDDGELPRMRVALRGQPLAAPIPGAVVEAEASLEGGGHVLVTTDDVPYEETLHVVLLDADGRVLEERRLTRASPGVVRDVAAAGDALSFRFRGDRVTEIRVAPRRLFGRRLRVTERSG